jgi:hypothetical protein
MAGMTGPGPCRRREDGFDPNWAEAEASRCTSIATVGPLAWGGRLLTLWFGKYTN